MKRSEDITELTKALVKFNSEVSKITKDASNPYFKNNYATLDQIVEEIRPLLTKNGLAIMQFPSGDGNTVSVTTLLIHESGQWIESEPINMKPVKNDPQAVGSCITYARRYSLQAFLSLNTGEDDDGNKATHTEPPQEELASEKQLNLITQLIQKNVNEKHSFAQLHEALKERLGTTKNMEEWTKQEASKAIAILQNKKK